MQRLRRKWLNAIPGACLALGAGALLLSLASVQGQKLFYEDFEGLQLGPPVEEGLYGDAVWTGDPPTGWTVDDSEMPGIGTALDGMTEWAGWGFAAKWWWVQKDNQRRGEFALASGTVAIADPDEWDDADHEPGLFNAYLTTPTIDLQGQAANSLVLVFASSWRPEALDDGTPDFPVVNGQPINNQTAVVSAQFDSSAPVEILRWDSISTSPTYHDHAPNELVVIPLNNPAGATGLKLEFAMLEAANDWWWAQDNIAVGVPPFISGVTNDGVSFTVSIIEALGKTVNQGSITAELNGTAITPLNVTKDGDRVLVSYSQAPQVFAPGQTYTVSLQFTANDSRQISDTVSFVGPSYTTVSATPTAVTAVITEPGYLSVNEGAGVQLLLDGAAVTPTSVTRSAANQVTVRYTPPTRFASASSHTLAVTFQTTQGVSVTDEKTFVTPAWASVPPFLATPIGTGAEAGVLWKTHLLQTSTRPGNIAGAEAQLRNEYGPSIHDPTFWDTQQGADGYFRLNWVNIDQVPAAAGRFNANATAPLNVTDDYIPGTPTQPVPDYVAAETRAFLELQAGFYTMVVNSDDGFQVTTGTANSPTYLVLGQYDSTRGSSDTVFYFNVEQAGIYFFRLLWFEGTGDARVEWFTLNADGSAALVNGAQTGAIKAYRTRTVAEPEIPVVTNVTISVVRNGNQVTITSDPAALPAGWVLQTAPSATGPWETQGGATTPVTVDIGAGNSFLRATRP